MEPLILVLTTLQYTFDHTRRVTIDHRVDESVVLGRWDSANEVHEEGNFDDGQVFRVHARLFLDDTGEIYIQDTGSSNGTFVNNDGLDLLQPRQLKKGDKVELGYWELDDYAEDI